MRNKLEALTRREVGKDVKFGFGVVGAFVQPVFAQEFGDCLRLFADLRGNIGILELPVFCNCDSGALRCPLHNCDNRYSTKYARMEGKEKDKKSLNQDLQDGRISRIKR